MFAKDREEDMKRKPDAKTSIILVLVILVGAVTFLWIQERRESQTERYNALMENFHTSLMKVAMTLKSLHELSAAMEEEGLFAQEDRVLSLASGHLIQHLGVWYGELSLTAAQLDPKGDDFYSDFFVWELLTAVRKLELAANQLLDPPLPDRDKLRPFRELLASSHTRLLDLVYTTPTHRLHTPEFRTELKSILDDLHAGLDLLLEDDKQRVLAMRE